MFWSIMPKGFFYIGNSVFINMLCAYIFYNNKKSFIAFCLFILSINNLIDEIFFDNTTIGWNELILGLTLPLFWHLKNKKDARKDPIR